jgi:hypothetical protein
MTTSNFKRKQDIRRKSPPKECQRRIVKERPEPEAPPAKNACPNIETMYKKFVCLCIVRHLQSKHAEETQGSTKTSTQSGSWV